MDLKFLIVLSLILVVGAVLLSMSRANLIVLMLLPASQMLGFVDPMTFAIKGAFDIHALLAGINAVILIISVMHLGDFGDAVFLKPMLVLIIFWIYGVLYPVFMGYSSLFYAFKASKEFLTIFSYFSVFLFLRKEFELNLAWKVIGYFALYYSLFEVLAQLLGPALADQSVYSFRKEVFVFWKVYLPFWPIILIALFNSFFHFVLGLSVHIFKTAFLSLGLLLTFYRSYLMATIATIPAVIFLAKQPFKRLFGQSFAMIGVFISIFLFLGLIAGSDRINLQKISDSFLFSGVNEFVTQSGGALVGREVFAKGRRDILQESPLIGFGFIDKDSKFGLQARSHIIGDLFGFIDKGNLDVELKFGYFGAALLYSNFLYIVFICLKIARRSQDLSLTVHSMTVAATILVYLCVQPVHATLTYSFSLFPLALILALLDREQVNVQRSRS